MPLLGLVGADERAYSQTGQTTDAGPNRGKHAPEFMLVAVTGHVAHQPAHGDAGEKPEPHPLEQVRLATTAHVDPADR